MKPKIQSIALLLMITAITGLFLSCSKPEMPQPNRLPQPQPPPPSLSGQEFLFDSLKWIFFDGRFDVGLDDIYLKSPARADLFPWLTHSTSINAEVLIKFDTASNWVAVKSIDLYDPVIPVQYMYWIYLNSLFVEMLPLNYQLIGRKASVKIKFL